VAVEAEENKASGKGLPVKKVEAKKPAAKSAGQLEEITDNRPREINLEKENTEDGIEITEEIANAFSKSFMTVSIYEVNRENSEEKLSETIKLDLSCLLFPKDNCEVSPYRFY
jgi:hypothetical protein